MRPFLALAAALVVLGLARDCPRHSGGHYADEERAATREGAMIAGVTPYGWTGAARRENGVG